MLTIGLDRRFVLQGFCGLVAGCLCLLTANTMFAQGNDLSSPDAVVRQFCQLDARGERLQGDRWRKNIAPLVMWPEEAGEVIVVISDYRVGKAVITDSTSRVAVTFDVLGSTDSDDFSRKIERRTITFVLEERQGKWKIKEPVTAPHVYWQNVIKHLGVIQQSEPQGRERLDVVIKQIRSAVARSRRP